LSVVDEVLVWVWAVRRKKTQTPLYTKIYHIFTYILSISQHLYIYVGSTCTYIYEISTIHIYKVGYTCLMILIDMVLARDKAED
jgi:hypothetical protein